MAVLARLGIILLGLVLLVDGFASLNTILMVIGMVFVVVGIIMSLEEQE